MTPHGPHPGIAEHGLADDCPRCAVIARDPASFLDRDNLRALWERMRATEGGDGGRRYRSGAEADAGYELWRVYLAVERLRAAGIEP